MRISDWSSECALPISFIDSIAIPVAAPRAVHFLAKSSYFDTWASRQFFSALGAIPVERGAGQAALDALDQQRRILEEGDRKSVVWGKSGSVRVDLGGRRIIKKKKREWTREKN